jgi:23S rRNA (cytosine1962-C5)-methyltransferase
LFLYSHDTPLLVLGLPGGAPPTLDRAWWCKRIDAALVLRASLIEDQTTTGYRILNGENDGFPGLVADCYADTIVVKIYSEAWLPHLAVVLEELVTATGPEMVVIRTARSLDVPGLPDGTVVFDTTGAGPTGPDDVWFAEHDLRFLAHPRHGQKTGFFLDQRDNRQRVRARSGGHDMLDLFSCTGGFSAAAAVGGARHVTSVDMSSSAIETAERVMQANAGPSGPTPWEGIVGDAFDVMRRLKREGRRFGMVVVDPPSFAQRQANIAGGLRAYGNLTELVLDLVEPGGTILQSSCSSRITAVAFFTKDHETAAASSRRLVEIERTGHAIDHPVTFPEGAYLKALIARVD